MHLLGNLLLASDYGEAVRISGMYRNFPVVTLDGEVFLPGGTISGGSANKSSQNVLALRSYLRESSSFLELLDEEIDRLSSTLSRRGKGDKVKGGHSKAARFGRSAEVGDEKDLEPFIQQRELD